MTRQNHDRNLTAPFNAICAVAKECFDIDLARATRQHACQWGDNPLKPTVIVQGHELSLFWDTPDNRAALENEAIATRLAGPLLSQIGIAVPEDLGFQIVDGERLLRARSHVEGITLAQWRTIHAPSPDAYDAKIAPQLGTLVGTLHAHASAKSLLVQHHEYETPTALNTTDLAQTVQGLRDAGMEPQVCGQFDRLARTHFSPRPHTYQKSPFVFSHGALTPETLLVTRDGQISGIKDWHTAAQRDLMSELATIEPFSTLGTSLFLEAYTKETSRALPSVSVHDMLQAQFFAIARLASRQLSPEERFLFVMDSFSRAEKQKKSPAKKPAITLSRR